MLLLPSGGPPRAAGAEGRRAGGRGGAERRPAQPHHPLPPVRGWPLAAGTLASHAQAAAGSQRSDAAHSLVHGAPHACTGTRQWRSQSSTSTRCGRHTHAVPLLPRGPNTPAGRHGRRTMRPGRWCASPPPAAGAAARRLSARCLHGGRQGRGGRRAAGVQRHRHGVRADGCAAEGELGGGSERRIDVWLVRGARALGWRRSSVRWVGQRRAWGAEGMRSAGCIAPGPRQLLRVASRRCGVNSRAWGAAWACKPAPITPPLFGTALRRGQDVHAGQHRARRHRHDPPLRGRDLQASLG